MPGVGGVVNLRTRLAKLEAGNDGPGSPDDLLNKVLEAIIGGPRSRGDLSVEELEAIIAEIDAQIAENERLELAAEAGVADAGP